MVSRKVVLMALLLAHLASCGSRKGDGSPNASGNLYLYKAGTVQQEFGYQDAAATIPWTTTAGAIPLDQAGKARVYVKAPVDQVITDSTGNPVDQALAADNHRGELVEVVNASYTGALTDPVTGLVTQGLGGVTSLQSILTNLGLSLGPDGQYLAGSGGTQRNYADWLRGLAVFVNDFGAKWDGLTDDTAAVQKAINFVAGRGGGKVMLPPGTGLIATGGSGLSINASGVVIEGSGGNVSIMKNMSGTASAITINTGLSNIALRSFAITANSNSTGAGVSATSTTGLIMEDFVVTGHDKSAALTSCSSVYIGSNCALTGNVSHAGSRAISATNVSQMVVVGGQYTGNELDIELLGTTNRVSMFGAVFAGATAGVGFNSGLSGDTFSFTGCVEAGGGTMFSMGAATFPTKFYQDGNQAFGAAFSVAVGNAITPDLTKGTEQSLTAASGGAGTVTVNAPAVLPNTTDRNKRWVFKFINGSGGAVTWTLNAVFKTTAAIPSTDGHTIVVEFLWDIASSKLREMSRADIAT